MGAIKRFAEEVSCVLGGQGLITPPIMKIANEALTTIIELGLKKEECVETNPKFRTAVLTARDTLTKKEQQDELAKQPK